LTSDEGPARKSVRGYGSSSALERSGFGFLTSFASTIAIARAINYVRERRRPLPRARSRWRRVSGLSRGDDIRVHHFLPGMGISLVSGGAAIATRGDGLELSLSIPFGIGTALTLDELGLLLDATNAYWRSQPFVLGSAAGAALGAAGLGALFLRRGSYVS
jgi:hypothetical protein